MCVYKKYILYQYYNCIKFFEMQPRSFSRMSLSEIRWTPNRMAALFKSTAS